MFKIIDVNPKHELWEIYLELSARYFKENWPEEFSGDLGSIKEKYNRELITRMDEGGRGLFLSYWKDDLYGLANVYISEISHLKVLNIAEFYIVPKMRRMKLGTQLFSDLLKWGQQNGSKRLKVEVFSNNRRAIDFWRSLQLVSSIDGNRTIYFGVIQDE